MFDVFRTHSPGLRHGHPMSVSTSGVSGLCGSACSVASAGAGQHTRHIINRQLHHPLSRDSTPSGKNNIIVMVTGVDDTNCQ